VRLFKYLHLFDESDFIVSGIRQFGHYNGLQAAPPMSSHMHENCMELVVLLRGSEDYKIEDEIYHVNAGEIFISFLNEPHCSGSDCQNPVESIWIQLNMTTPGEFLGLSASKSNELKQKLMNLQEHVIQADKKCMEIIKDCFYLFLSGKREKILVGEALFTAFLYRVFSLQAQICKGDSEMMKIKKHIDDHIYSVLSTEAISQQYFMSLSSLRDKFIEETGRTLRDYINHKKIEKSKELLKSGKSITETAMALSFNTSDYFSVVFKKYTSISPSEYIKKHQKK